jgi:2'-5' RNA ligase
MLPVLDEMRKSGADVKWESAEKLHATIRFLGSTDGSLLPRLASDLQALSGSHQPMKVRYHGVGCFPDMKRPRVVWIGIEDPDGALAALQQSVETVVTALGFKREERRFHPHVTLGRVRSLHRVARLLTTFETITFDTEPVVLTEFSLVRSDLRPDGSVYTVMGTFPLAGS